MPSGCFSKGKCDLHWGKAYRTKAIRAVLAYGFSTLAGILFAATGATAGRTASAG